MRCLCTGSERGTTKEERARYNQGSYRWYTLPRGVGVGCLRVLMEWFVCMVRIVLSLAVVGTKPSCARETETGMFISKTAKAVRHLTGVVGRGVGVKCCGVQGCCAGERPM